MYADGINISNSFTCTGTYSNPVKAGSDAYKLNDAVKGMDYGFAVGSSPHRFYSTEGHTMCSRFNGPIGNRDYSFNHVGTIPNRFGNCEGQTSPNRFDIPLRNETVCDSVRVPFTAEKDINSRFSDPVRQVTLCDGYNSPIKNSAYHSDRVNILVENQMNYNTSGHERAVEYEVPLCIKDRFDSTATFRHEGKSTNAQHVMNISQSLSELNSRTETKYNKLGAVEEEPQFKVCRQCNTKEDLNTGPEIGIELTKGISSKTECVPVKINKNVTEHSISDQELDGCSKKEETTKDSSSDQEMADYSKKTETACLNRQITDCSQKKDITEHTSPDKLATNSKEKDITEPVNSDQQVVDFSKLTGKLGNTCDVCSKSYGRKDHLMRHMRTTHSELRPFVCRVCAQTFSRKDRLLRHEKIHSGVPQFSCDLCDKCFIRRDSLKKHSRTHCKKAKDITDSSPLNTSEIL